MHAKSHGLSQLIFSLFFFFNDTATTEIYTLSLHDALPISSQSVDRITAELQDGVMKTRLQPIRTAWAAFPRVVRDLALARSEEHTSELQSHSDLVCRLLLEKKKTNRQTQQDRQAHRYKVER